MSSPAVQLRTQLESLLTPMPGPDPTGESLRYEGTYDRILEARREDDPTLSQGVWKAAMKKSDWWEVERICLSELEIRSKDLQIAAWLMEAWLHLRKFPGLSNGLELMHGLLDRYWDNLHPQIEGDDLEYRIAPITWTNEKLSIQIKLLPITSPQNDEAPAYCWSDWENACRIETSDSKARAAGRLTLPEFQKSVMLTPTEFMLRTTAELERAMAACSAIEAILDRHCGKTGPSLRQLWNVMESVRSLMISWLSQRPAGEETPPPTFSAEIEEEQQELQPADEPVMWTQPTSIRSRDEAYQRLAEAADYLMRTEPHSPTPYLVRRAIAWGGLSLPELLHELVRSENEFTEISRLLQLSVDKSAK